MKRIDLPIPYGSNSSYADTPTEGYLYDIAISLRELCEIANRLVPPEETLHSGRINYAELSAKVDKIINDKRR